MKRFIGTLCALLAVVAVTPAAVHAHQGDPNFRSEITSISPEAAADGLQLTVKNFDDHLELVNRSGEVVIIEGYDGEPYLRFDPSGRVDVNLNSPAHYLNEDRLAAVSVPDRADSDAEPDWEQIDDGGRYFWHDHRSHYMSTQMPPQVTDESVVTKIFDYSIPMTVGGQPVEAAGTLTWVGSDGGPPILALAGLTVLVVAGAAVLVLRRRREDEPTDGPGDPGEESPASEAW